MREGEGEGEGEGEVEGEGHGQVSRGSTLRPANSEAMGESFWRTDLERRPCCGMINVRAT